MLLDCTRPLSLTQSGECCWDCILSLTQSGECCLDIILSTDTVRRMLLGLHPVTDTVRRMLLGYHPVTDTVRRMLLGLHPVTDNTLHSVSSSNCRNTGFFEFINLVINLIHIFTRSDWCWTEQLQDCSVTRECLTQ